MIEFPALSESLSLRGEQLDLLSQQIRLRLPRWLAWLAAASPAEVEAAGPRAQLQRRLLAWIGDQAASTAFVAEILLSGRVHSATILKDHSTDMTAQYSRLWRRLKLHQAVALDDTSTEQSRAHAGACQRLLEAVHVVEGLGHVTELISPLVAFVPSDAVVTEPNPQAPGPKGILKRIAQTEFGAAPSYWLHRRPIPGESTHWVVKVKVGLSGGFNVIHFR